MLLRDVNTGNICTEKDLVIHWEMDMTFDYLNPEDPDQEPQPISFAQWLKEMIEEGEYEVVG